MRACVRARCCRCVETELFFVVVGENRGKSVGRIIAKKTRQVHKTIMDKKSRTPPTQAPPKAGRSKGSSERSPRKWPARAVGRAENKLGEKEYGMDIYSSSLGTTPTLARLERRFKCPKQGEEYSRLSTA